MKVEFNKNAAISKIQKAAAQVVATIAVDLQGRIKTKLAAHNSSLTGGLNASPPGSPPGNRTGALLRSIDAINVTTDANHPHWRVGTKLPYAKIQEYGGRIRPKNVKYLPVPIGASGVRALREAAGKSLRTLNLKVFKAPNGKLFLYRPADPGAKKKDRRIDKLLFRLVKSIYLPARPYFRPAIAEQRLALKAELI